MKNMNKAQETCTEKAKGYMIIRRERLSKREAKYGTGNKNLKEMQTDA